MTTSLNAFSKAGLANILGNTLAVRLLEAGAVIRVYPSTVAYPSSPVETGAALPAGHILTFTGITYTVSGNNISATGGTLTANTTAAGTLSWWAAFYTAAGTNPVISDSISLNGGTGIVFIGNSGNSLTVTSGQTQTIAFNLQFA